MKYQGNERRMIQVCILSINPTPKLFAHTLLYSHRVYALFDEKYEYSAENQSYFSSDVNQLNHHFWEWMNLGQIVLISTNLFIFLFCL